MTAPYQPGPLPRFEPQPTAPAPKQKKGRVHWAFLVLTFFVGLLLGSIGGSTDEQEPAAAPATPAPTYSAPAPTYEAPTPAAAPEPAPTVNGFAEGDYLVGPEIEPGKYRSTGAKPGFIELCSASTKSANGDVMEWETANANESVLITVSPKAEIFSNSGCEPFVKVN